MIKQKKKFLVGYFLFHFLFFIPIFATFELIKNNRDEITNDFNNNKTLVCKVNNIK